MDTATSLKIFWTSGSKGHTITLAKELSASRFAGRCRRIPGTVRDINTQLLLIASAVLTMRWKEMSRSVKHCRYYAIIGDNKLDLLCRINADFWRWYGSRLVQCIWQTEGETIRTLAKSY
jgi:hypothetical protein